LLPIRDSVRSRTTPIVTILIIVLNVLVFMHELSLGRDVEAFIEQWALIPHEFVYWKELGGGVGDIDRYIPIFSSMFLHGGWAHIIGNMLYLWIFGDNIEDRLGHFKFLLFYLGCGAVAALAQTWIDPQSTLPVIGASGAVAGVLGAYFVTYPSARVLTLVPLFLWPWFVEIPALVFLGLWFVLQLISGASAIGVPVMGGGVAFWAHVGGFAAGALVGLLWRRRGHRGRVALRAW
jgi:membrane associated rhomboid family serine protease